MFGHQVFGVVGVVVDVMETENVTNFMRNSPLVRSTRDDRSWFPVPVLRTAIAAIKLIAKYGGDEMQNNIFVSGAASEEGQLPQLARNISPCWSNPL